jgi:hypothetical protein
MAEGCYVNPAFYAECHAECHAECRYAECRGAGFSFGRLLLRLICDKSLYFIKYSAALFYIENDDETFTVHYTWKAAEKGYKMAFV